MNLKTDIHWKSLIIGSAIATTLIIIGSNGYDILIPFSAIGFLYVGYNGKDIKWGTLLGAVSAVPLVIASYYGMLPSFITETSNWLYIVMLSFLLVGAFIGFVGAWARRDREKAKLEYEKKQKIGKNKKKK